MLSVFLMIVFLARVGQSLVCISRMARQIELSSYVYWSFVFNFLKIVDLVSPLIVIYNFLLRVYIYTHI